MCYIITTILPKNADTQKIEPIFKASGLCLDEIEDKSLNNQTEDNYRFFHTTKTCDCGTFLGYLRQKNKDKNEFDKIAIKKKKQGWSEAKIKRWLKDKKENKEKTQVEMDKAKNKEAEKCLSFLKNILNSEVNFIGILLHFEDKNNPLKVKEVKKIKIDKIDKINKINKEFLLNIEDDILYEFF